MESGIYIGQIMHQRLAPKKHQFTYDVFMFYLDVDEIEALSMSHTLFGWNRFSLFSFHDKHHANFPNNTLGKEAKTKEKILDFASQAGIPKNQIASVKILTNLSTLGYLFNPVCFYFCFDAQQNPICAVAEVTNTFKEMKLYFLGPETLKDQCFRQKLAKEFYVSPFSTLDTYFEFILPVPQQKMNLRVDDYENKELDQKRYFLSHLSGLRTDFKDSRLLICFFSIPFITLKIIFLIYFEAMKLHLKKAPFIRKKENTHLQTNLVKL